MKAYCYNCGETADYRVVLPIGDELKSAWGLSDKAAKRFNQREGLICTVCGANIRAQGLAKAILESKHGLGQESLRAWVRHPEAKGLKVCELNSCHELHQTLSGLKGLTYSEYGTGTEENIESLSYADDTFDLLLHSETLEHVSNPGKAMDECRRVIKSGGLILFTTPVVWNRKTRRRSELTGKKPTYILPQPTTAKKLMITWSTSNSATISVKY